MIKQIRIQFVFPLQFLCITLCYRENSWAETSKKNLHLQRLHIEGAAGGNCSIFVITKSRSINDIPPSGTQLLSGYCWLKAFVFFSPRIPTVVWIFCWEMKSSTESLPRFLWVTYRLLYTGNLGYVAECVTFIKLKAISWDVKAIEITMEKARESLRLQPGQRIKCRDLSMEYKLECQGRIPSRFWPSPTDYILYLKKKKKKIFKYSCSCLKDHLILHIYMLIYKEFWKII